MIQAAGNIVNGLFTGMMENAPLLISTGMELLNQFLLGIATGVPALITKGFEIVTQLVLGILQNLPQLITQGAAVITNFVNGLLSSLPSVWQFRRPDDSPPCGWNYKQPSVYCISRSAGNSAVCSQRRK